MGNEVPYHQDAKHNDSDAHDTLAREEGHVHRRPGLRLSEAQEGEARDSLVVLGDAVAQPDHLAEHGVLLQVDLDLADVFLDTLGPDNLQPYIRFDLEASARDLAMDLHVSEDHDGVHLFEP